MVKSDHDRSLMVSSSSRCAHVFMWCAFKCTVVNKESFLLSGEG